MSIGDLLFKLLQPLTTGKTGSEATIGRFGIGFFSVLGFLQHPDARIFVESKQGESLSRLILTPPLVDGIDPQVAIDICRGTEALLADSQTKVWVCGELDLDEVEKLLRRKLQYCRSTAIFFADERINPKWRGGRATAASEGGELWWQPNESRRTSRLTLVVRGESIVGPFDVAQPQGGGMEIVWELPDDSEIMMSRDLPVVDEAFLEKFQAVLELKSILEPAPETWVNLLSELAERLELRGQARSRQALDRALKQHLTELRRLGNPLFLPADPKLEVLDFAALESPFEGTGRRVSSLHRRLWKSEGSSSLDDLRMEHGKELFAVPFKAAEPDEETPDRPATIQVGAATFVDAQLKPKHMVGEVALSLLGTRYLDPETIDAGGA